jgi:O-antigen/teichoic acid export membrane protein
MPKGSLTRFLLKGSVAVFVARLLGILGGFGSQTALARLVTPETLGTFFLIQSIVLLGANMGEFGLNRPLSRMVAEDVGKGEAGAALEVLWSSLQISALSTFCALILVMSGPGEWIAIHVYYSRGMGDVLALLGLWIVAQIVVDISSSALQGIHRVGTAAFLNSAIAPIAVAIGCGFLLYRNIPADLQLVVIIATSACVLSALVCLALIFASFNGERRLGPSRRLALISASYPIFLSGLIEVAAGQADLWIVAAQLDPTQVALYGAAKRLGLLMGFPVLVLTSVLPPLITELYCKNQRSRLEILLRAATTAVSVPLSLVLLFSFLYGREILTVLFGEVYADASPLLLVFCVRGLLLSLLGMGSLLLIMIGEERTVFRISFLTSTFSLVAVYLGGVVGGSIGIAVSSSLSAVLSAAWFLLEARRKTKVWSHANPLAIVHILNALQSLIRSKINI